MDSLMCKHTQLANIARLWCITIKALANSPVGQVLYYDTVDRNSIWWGGNNQLPMHAKYFILHKVFHYAKIK